jgi:predicted phosphate transport protein (TIGR00153 family)
VLRRLLPKKDIFFRFMEAQAAKGVEASAALRAMFVDLENGEAHLGKVKDIEHEADSIAHDAIAELSRSFITPLDRNEISRMTKRLDDIVDLLESVAQRMFRYELKTFPEPAVRLMDVIEKQVEYVQEMVGQLSDLKHSEGIRAAIIEIHSLENEADEILRPAIADLFRQESDTGQVIKWKEVYEYLERATDRCEDVADLVESIVLEYA